jgi:AcrR family transcriptional regulator
MTRTGRRPGHRDTRAEIVDAARAVFSEVGYARASLRRVAQRAGVDPALVHHYFGGKVSLFVEVMELPRDLPDAGAELGAREPPEGSAVVRAFLRLWDSHGADADGPSPFLSIVQAICSSPQAAESLTEFAAERFWPQAEGSATDRESRLRRALVGAQLMGLGFQRYVLRMGPIATAEPSEIASWMGPTIDRYLRDALGGSPDREDPSVSAAPLSAQRNGGHP